MGNNDPGRVVHDEVMNSDHIPTCTQSKLDTVLDYIMGSETETLDLQSPLGKTGAAGHSLVDTVEDEIEERIEVDDLMEY